MPTKIIFDTDPGIDDCMALFLALRSPELDVVGVTTVFGNTPTEQCARNAQRALHLAGRGDIPVCLGAQRPLARAPLPARAIVHGTDGLGDAFLNAPPLPGELHPLSAAEFIVQQARSQPGALTLIAVGALTNVALALHLEPRLPTLIQRVVIMGGAALCPGNITPVAEANLYHDPEAAALVFSAGWPLTMIGLDVTLKTIMSPEYIAALNQPPNPFGDFITRTTPHYAAFYAEDSPTLGGLPTHDPSAVAYVIDPALFGVERLPVYVETQGQCAGQTVVDRARRWPASAEINVALTVDAPRLLTLYAERIKKP